jgi:hypothetical protein
MVNNMVIGKYIMIMVNYGVKETMLMVNDMVILMNIIMMVN